MRQLKIFTDFYGKEPFKKWFDDLIEEYQIIVDKYLSRVAKGGTRKNIKAIGFGVFELKIDYGPGLRIYFGEDGLELIILLARGDKSTQNKDIHDAIKYWNEYEKIKKLQ